MGINWIRLYELSNEDNKISGTRFEKLVLDYLNQYYRKYKWENTKSSWDNNRDFISLILENIWAEAKYKKDCTALKKTDIDPTMMSGLLNGRIEVIFFLTNGHLPDTLMERIKQAGRMYSFQVICITKTQLEYWLYLHPDKYEKHFLEKLDISQKNVSAVHIKEIDFLDPVNSNNNLLAIKHELYEQYFYVFYITIEANIPSEMVILDNDYPFSFVCSTGYENYECIQIRPGIQQLKFLIYTNKCYDSSVTLKYKINEEVSLSSFFPLRICADQKVKLTYSEQLKNKEEIIRLLSNQNSNEQLILLGGEYGFGKTYLLKEVMWHFYATRQIMYFDFYAGGDYRNAIELCRLIIYIDFGGIVNYFKKEESDDIINYYKELLNEQLDPESGDLDLISKIIDGCYDEVCANQILKSILCDPQFLNKVILHRHDPLAHLALLDNTEQLNSSEYNAVKSVIDHSICCNNIRILLSTLGCKNDCDFYLSGLTFDDIKSSLANNFRNWSSAFIDVIYKELPCCPASFIDTVEVLKYNLDEEDDMSLTSAYLFLSDKAANLTVYKTGFSLDREHIEILSFIYLFENGLPREILYDLGISDEQINILRKAQYIKCSSGTVKMYSKFYRNAFLKEYQDACTDYIAGCLNKLLENISKYGKLIFLPEIYEKYIEIGKISAVRISTDLLEHMRNYSYVCDYRNMYAYGKIAYYFIGQKNPEELSESDCMMLFYYGISLLHCDRKRGAIEIFRKVQSSAPLGSNAYLMASCELYNNLYNLFQINQLEDEILITLTELERKIKCIRDEADHSALDMRIAYSTCMNRYMMILFMQDRFSDASYIFKKYAKYNCDIPISLYSYKYQSMMGEWYLDYARGMSSEEPEIAEHFLQMSIGLLEDGTNEKRYILAKMDLAFLRCVYYEKYDEIETIHEITTTLQEKKYINEYFRGIIRENLCKLVLYSQKTDVANSKGIKKVAQIMKEEALNAELDSMLYINGRLAYQTKMYFSVLDVIVQDFDEAKKYLEQILHMVAEAGDSFKNIIFHNLEYYKEIKTIEWKNKENSCSPFSFVLDPRIW